MKNIIIAGGSGLIGQYLVRTCVRAGHHVTILSRSEKDKLNSDNIKTSVWNPEKKIVDIEVLKKSNIIINLSGVGIAEKRWTAKRKKEIIESRVRSNTLLIESLLSNGIFIDKYISASAIGYYGNRPGEILDEKSKKGEGFLADVCEKWEKPLEQLDGKIKSYALRFGMVLTPGSGALEPMKKGLPFVCPYFGSGKQYISWIHIEDLCLMMLHLINNDIPSGVFNAVAPDPVIAKQFAKVLARTSETRALTVSIPAFVAKLLLGEMAALMLDDANISSDKITNTGFDFRYKTIEKALEDLIN